MLIIILIINLLIAYITVKNNYRNKRQLCFLIKTINRMSQELVDLQAAVAQESTVIDSAIVLLKGIKIALDEAIASQDPKALKALSDEIGAKTASLAQAVEENTP